MNQFCTIYLLRHGESEGNRDGILQGHVNSPLTSQGEAQAAARAQELKHIPFAAAFSSDLIRAQKTAEIIASEHQLAVKTNLLIRERFQGRLEGKVWQEIQQELRKELNRRNQLPHHQRAKHRFDPTYENDEEITARMITFLREIAVAYLGKTVLVASHGGIIRALLVHLGHTSYDNLPSEAVDNTGYVILKSDGTDFFFKGSSGVRLANS